MSVEIEYISKIYILHSLHKTTLGFECCNLAVPDLKLIFRLHNFHVEKIYYFL